MARVIAPENLSMVIDAIRQQGGSARLEEISSKIAKPVPRRTLQRWLKTLTQAGRVEVVGQGPVTVYRIPAAVPAVSATEEGIEDKDIPLSIPGKEILDYVRQPLSARQPYPHNPYGYYTFLRLVCCGVFGYLVYAAVVEKMTAWAWLFAITALIYNPFVSVHLTRNIWSVINVITIGVAIASIWVCSSQKKKNG